MYNNHNKNKNKNNNNNNNKQWEVTSHEQLTSHTEQAHTNMYNNHSNNKNNTTTTIPLDSFGA